MSDPEDRLSPAERYDLTGHFDPDSYDEDLKAFPDCFSDDGWPRFGGYDPYALTHPITGLSWHHDPREPTDDEEDADYARWFLLAVQFNSIRRQLHLAGQPPAPLPDEKPDDGAVYLTKSRRAAHGNLRFMRKLLPEVGALLSERNASPEFALLWGEFRWLAEGLSMAIPTSIRRRKLRESGRVGNKDAQVKWCLHWHRLDEERGWTPRQSNNQLLKLLSDITKGTRATPEGFDIEWFGRMKSDPKKAGARGRALSDKFQRLNQHPRRGQLLSSGPEDDPAIPPVDLSAYPLKG